MPIVRLRIGILALAIPVDDARIGLMIAMRDASRSTLVVRGITIFAMMVLS